MDCEITRAAECDLKRMGVLGMAEGQVKASNITYQSNITQMGDSVGRYSIGETV